MILLSDVTRKQTQKECILIVLLLNGEPRIEYVAVPYVDHRLFLLLVDQGLIMFVRYDIIYLNIDHVSLD